jgi:hypothetical protein
MCRRGQLSRQRLAGRHASDDGLLAPVQLLGVRDLTVQIGFELLQVADAVFVVFHDRLYSAGILPLPRCIAQARLQIPLPAATIRNLIGYFSVLLPWNNVLRNSRWKDQSTKLTV